MTRRRWGWMILLSRPPAIATYYAIDKQGVYYATSQPDRALVFRRRADAERINRSRGLDGLVVSSRA